MKMINYALLSFLFIVSCSKKPNSNESEGYESHKELLNELKLVVNKLGVIVSDIEDEETSSSIKKLESELQLLHNKLKTLKVADESVRASVRAEIIEYNRKNSKPSFKLLKNIYLKNPDDSEHKESFKNINFELTRLENFCDVMYGDHLVSVEIGRDSHYSVMLIQQQMNREMWGALCQVSDDNSCNDLLSLISKLSERLKSDVIILKKIGKPDNHTGNIVFLEMEEHFKSLENSYAQAAKNVVSKPKLYAKIKPELAKLKISSDGFAVLSDVFYSKTVMSK